MSITMSPRFSELDLEVQLKLNGIINSLASAGSLIPKSRTLKLLKHLHQHLDELLRLGMWIDDNDRKNERRREKRQEKKYQERLAKGEDVDDSDDSEDDD